jgi:F0F1-type ATP synthase gamma subunit
MLEKKKTMSSVSASTTSITADRGFVGSYKVTVRKRVEKSLTNCRGPAIRKGAQGLTILRMFLSLTAVSLSIDCTNYLPINP